MSDLWGWEDNWSMCRAFTILCFSYTTEMTDEKTAVKVVPLYHFIF